MEKTLGFSEPFITVEYINDEENYEITEKTIVVNLSQKTIKINEIELKPLQSSIFANSTINIADDLLVVTVPKEDFLGTKTKIDEDIIKNTWHHVYDFFNITKLSKTPLWLSEKKTIGKYTLNLWYAPKGIECGIHKDHPFLEVHTQLLGMGSLQLFQENNVETLYQETIMSPGFTHQPLYNKALKYPWHQYYTHTDSIWLAIEK